MRKTAIQQPPVHTTVRTPVYLREVVDRLDRRCDKNKHVAKFLFVLGITEWERRRLTSKHTSQMGKKVSEVLVAAGKKEERTLTAAAAAEKSGLPEKASVAAAQGSISETGAAAAGFFAFSPSGARAKPLQMSRHRKSSPRRRRRHHGSKSPLLQPFSSTALA
ncbi:hypothetical protein MTO96_015949 [Rhipicephalus appendiculatus]